MAALKVMGTILLVVSAAVAAPAQAPQERPQVRVNILNVCALNDADQKEIAAALERVPRRPVFAPDFEVARGRFVDAKDGTPSRFVRIRHEFGVQSPFANAQYSFSVDDKGTVETTETLVLRLRDAKDLMQIAIESHVTGLKPVTVLTGDQDAGRVRLERFGKNSIVLARCAGADQTAYEPLFRAASEILRRYRAELNAARTVVGELEKISAPAIMKKPAPAAKKR